MKIKILNISRSNFKQNRTNGLKQESKTFTETVTINQVI